MKLKARNLRLKVRLMLLMSFDCASKFSQVTAEQEFELYSKVCDVLFQQKRSLEMIMIPLLTLLPQVC